MPTTSDDVTEARLLEIMREFMKKGFDVYVKWTCPKCGERVTCPTANSFYPAGFIHEEKADGSACGELYLGPTYGVMAVIALT